MKKITIILLIIVSLILPQTVEAADDAPYNAWDSCAKNFVKYSNKGEYCIIVEVSGGTKDIQYILIHDIANRNPMIYEGGAGRRFLNLYDTSRYEVYYSDKVQSLTGLGSVFSGDKLELGITQPTSGFRAEIVRTNYTLFNMNGQVIYDPNYISEVTEFYDENDKPDHYGIPFDCPYTVTVNNPIYTFSRNVYVQCVAVFEITNVNDKTKIYKYAAPVEMDGKKFNFTGQYSIVKNEDGYDNVYLEVDKEFDTTVQANYYNMYTGDLTRDITLDGWPSTGFSPNFKYTDSERAAYRVFIGSPDQYELTGLNFEWYFDSPITRPITPTPLVKPTAAPLVSPGPIAGEDNGVFNLGQTIKRIFLPSPDILYNEVNASKDLLLNKLHIDLDSFDPQNAGRPQNVTMTIYGHNVTLLDFQQIEDVVAQATSPINIARVFIYIFSLWGLIKFIIDYFNNRGGGAVNA